MSNAETWSAFRRRCYKPGSSRLGTRTARYVARPIALGITWLVLPLGVTAHQATTASMVVALTAVFVLGVGSPVAGLVGGVLLELWYLVDHVDGQIARARGTASLDGTALDYLMHHLVNFAVPLGAAYGMVRETGSPAWFIGGAVWSAALLAIGLRHDVRYKAFVQRLKVVVGTLDAIGGGGGRPAVAPDPVGARGVAAWCILKLTEMHVLAHLFVVVGIVRSMSAALDHLAATAMFAVPALAACVAAVLLIVRELHSGEAETQFKAWFRVPDDHGLVYRDGFWHVVESKVVAERIAPRCDAPVSSS
jgi:phosphatidylglycerophosphate synthase